MVGRTKRASLPLSLLALAGCATPLEVGQTPSAHAIAQIESGYRLLQIIVEVGVVDNLSMNSASRVQVRRVSCKAEGSTAATCSYDANRCLENEATSDEDGWCHRVARYVRIDRPSDPFQVAMIAEGWTVDRPRPD